YAGDTPFSRLVELNLSNLAGVPSVVYGILGLSVFVRLLGLGPVILAGALTLTLLVVPVVVVAAREAIRSVPDSLRQAAYGLGATRSQVVFRVVLPGAVSGITTGVILAVARALGETAPLLVIGAAAFVPRPPAGPLSPFTAIPIQVYNWVSENDVEFTHVASAAIVVLLLVLGVLYSLAFYLRRRYESRWGGAGGGTLTEAVRVPEETVRHDPVPVEEAAVVITDLSLWYGSYQAIHRVSLTVPRNQVTALIGASGSGKSTLLRSINRMNDLVEGVRVEGSVRYDGVELYGPDVDPVEVRRRIGMVFQKPNPFPKSIYENVAFGPRLMGFRGDMDALVERALRSAALWDEVKDKLKQSG